MNDPSPPAPPPSHPTAKTLLQQRLALRWHQIFKTDPGEKYQRALSSLLSDEVRPCDGDESIDLALQFLLASIIHLQCGHYEAQASLQKQVASKFGALLDTALQLSAHVVEVHGGDFRERPDEEPSDGSGDPAGDPTE